MAENSAIQWTTHTFNPWRGCTKVSDGCKHCYAETMSKRNTKTLGMWGPSGTRVVASEAQWRLPLKWDRVAKASGERHRVFCASLADVFEGRDTMPERSWAAVEAARARLFEVIGSTPNLDWLLLTKRPENIVKLWPGTVKDYYPDGWPNVWLGTSVENQEAADKRIPELLKVPAKVRFLSMEPLLGPVDLSRWLDWKTHRKCEKCKGIGPDGERCSKCGESAMCTSAIDWAIVGGESGHHARPMQLEWARSLRDQCKAAGVAFFMKQLGGRGDKGGELDDMPPDLRTREFPEDHS